MGPIICADCGATIYPDGPNPPPGCKCDPWEWVCSSGAGIPPICDEFVPMGGSGPNLCERCEHLKACHTKPKGEKMRPFLERICITLWFIWGSLAFGFIIAGLFNPSELSWKNITMFFGWFSFLGVSVSLFQYLLIGIFNPINLCHREG